MKTTARYGVRPVVSDDDYALYAQFFQRYAPDRPMSVNEFKMFDEAKPGHVARRRCLVTESGNEIAGLLVTQAHWQTDQSLYQIEVLAQPGMEASHLHGLFDLAESLTVESSGEKVTAWVPDRQTGVMAVLAERGYEVVQKNPESQLLSGHFVGAKFEANLANFGATGLRVVTLVELSEMFPDNWLRMFYDAEWELSEDVPRAFEREREPFETFQTHVEYDKSSHRFHRFAMDGDRIVGMTMLIRNEVDPSIFWTGLTGVARDWRRKGVATVLKVLNISAALEAGARTVSCDNEESNPMLQLNRALGFRPVYNWCDHRKALA